jgi:very-short-patch-repair endonuclease
LSGLRGILPAMEDHLRRLARRQRGLFTRAQARACGYSAKQIRQRVRAGRWQAVIGSTLAEAGLVLTPVLSDRAAHLAVAGSVLAGPAAARDWGMPVPPSPPYLAVGVDHHPSLAGARFIRTTLDPRDVCLSDGARVTGRERTIVDCLRLLPEADAQSLLDRALQRRWMDLDGLARRVGVHSGQPGKHRLVRLLRLASAGTVSEAERVAARLLQRAGIAGWRANQPIYDGADLIAVGDLVFERVRLVIEVDGWSYHADVEAFQRDRRRQNRLVAAGWTVLRFTWWDLTQRPDSVVSSIRAMVIRLAG